MNNAPKRILCLWLPNWPVQRLTVARRARSSRTPSPASRPLVLHRRDARRGQQVVACCSAAYEIGIRRNMTLTEASALSAHQRSFTNKREGEAPAEEGATAGSYSGSAGASPSRVVRKANVNEHQKMVRGANDDSRRSIHDRIETEYLEHEPNADLDALRALADWCQRYSPAVGLESFDPNDKTSAPSALLMDITGSAPRLGREETLAQRACEDFSDRNLIIRGAVAGTVGAAWASAHFGHLTPHAKSSYLIVPRGRDAAKRALGKLPVESLRLTNKIVHTLHALGVRDVNQLLQLPRSGLAARFDEQLITRLDQALGNISEPVILYQAAAPLSVHRLLEHPTARIDSLETVIRELLLELQTRLTEQQRGVLQMQCRLVPKQAAPLIMQLGLFHPTTSARHLFELLQMQLENHKLAAEVHCVELNAKVTSAVEQQQAALLDDMPGIDPSQLTHLVNRLSSRLGSQSIVTARRQAAAQPEDSFFYEALAGKMRRRSGTGSQRKSPGLRPLQLLPSAIALRATSIAPDGPPVSFDLCGATYRIAHCWGPERIETGWWKGPLVRRDYYRVEDHNGKRFWLYRNLNDGKWFVHGVF